MKYMSTRGDQARLTAAEAILRGLAPDSGLYLPEVFPEFTMDDIQAMISLPYADRAALVLSRFLTDYSLEELTGYTTEAYRASRFGGNSPAPVVNLNDTASILELFHGPTCAFKDFALQMLPRLLSGALKKTGETRTICILTATSGDTGKAALDGFADVDQTAIAVFYPDGGTSPIQRLQMTTQEGNNVHVFAVHGNFDDAQNGVKRLFADEALREALNQEGYLFSSANSINWGRLAPQIAYYFSAYCDMVASGRLKQGELLNVCVPTGNFGNILACYIAKKCGLPIGKMICASNRNNVLTDFLETGTYDRNREFYTTMSPSMDILISSNLERLLALSCDRDCAKVAALMTSLNQTGSYTVDPDMFARIHADFSCGYADDSKTLDTIAEVYKTYDYLMDTHTAVAYAVYQEYKLQTGDETPTLIASTASPFKFPASVLKALDQEVPENDFAQLDILAKVSELEAPESLSGLRSKTERFTEVIEPLKMEQAVTGWLKSR